MLPRALVSTIRDSALARLMAVLCAVALLACGFAHSVHQFNTPIPTVAMQADAGTPDDSPDTSKKASIAIEQCHCCSMIALADLTRPFVPHDIAADLPMRRVDEVRPYPPVVELPPPISTI